MTTSPKIAMGLFAARVSVEAFDALFEEIMDDDLTADQFEFKLQSTETGEVVVVSLDDARTAMSNALAARSVASLVGLSDHEFNEALAEMPDKAVSIMTSAMMLALKVSPNQEITDRLLERQPMLDDECAKRGIDPFVFADEEMEA